MGNRIFVVFLVGIIAVLLSALGVLAAVMISGDTLHLSIEDGKVSLTDDKDDTETEEVKPDQNDDILSDENITTTTDVEYSIDSPLPGSENACGDIQVSGYLPGTWFFEAEFPVRLYDANNNLLSESYATAEEEWMTEDQVRFTAVLECENYSGDAVIVLEKANPSDLTVNDGEIAIPIDVVKL